MKRLNDQRGNILIAVLLVTFMLMAMIVQYSNWVMRTTKDNVRHLAGQHAMVNADSGVQLALQFLRTPKASQLVPGEPFALASITAGTTNYITLTRGVADHGLIDLYSTGYYQLAGSGQVADPYGTKSQLATVHAQVHLHNVGDYFAATPGSLEVTYGSNISSGMIYGKDIIFGTGSTNPRTQLKAAAYFNSIQPSDFANYVTFLDANQPVQMYNEPNLPTLDASMRNLYQNMAGTDVLAAGAVLSGSLDGPAGNPYHVLFSPGDVTLGANGSSCTLNSSFLIYSQGNIYIANTIKGTSNIAAQAALMAEGNIYITASAPDTLSIGATMVTNGQLKALGPARAGGKLTINGGVVAGGGIAVGDVYAQSRNYTYQGPDPTLPLPFTTEVTLYKVTRGKFQ
jgi:hypothetical protein